MNNERFAEPQVGKTVFWVQICPEYERIDDGPFAKLVADGCTQCKYFDKGDNALMGTCQYKKSE